MADILTPAPDQPVATPAPIVMAVVPVKSPWWSTINWVAITQMAASAAVFFHAPVTTDNLTGLASSVTFLFGLYVWIRHTWFESSTLSSSIPKG